MWMIFVGAHSCAPLPDVYCIQLKTEIGFEAGFSISETKAIIFTGQVIDSHGKELFWSQDLSRS
ncbi:hypothetical protein C7Y66_26010 [Chroococcidiopsis sp. CCALA 051]|uniref:hypothetical protein n=1 Tax=Chroococcidiopsis sp. CCALA 051 TaxID=869949 RepID=UPI000D0D0AF8|nr:hypothetical protein [Chroococcidiopsis sp. CCALA 051]MBE9018272.1 hypothetical protein [Chroococcidiopsidales cyanobacterium LEGE 13417]PSM46255.1 hypothetical protein C7Y66_26010 [Chroococcidiopsis sp. CCALA 051]